MRIGRVLGTVTMTRKLERLAPGRFLIVEALDGRALAGRGAGARRATAMPESLVVFDHLGAGAGQIVAFSEGREAAMPFYPEKVPLDAYVAAILDEIEYEV